MIKRASLTAGTKDFSRHGLWVFHRLARSAQSKWWAGESELREVHQLVSYFEMVRPTPKHEIVERCAKRYMRMFRGNRYSVGEWDALVLTICRRSGLDHHGTIRAVTFGYRFRRESPVIKSRRWSNDVYEWWRPRFTRAEIEKRAESIFRIRREKRYRENNKKWKELEAVNRDVTQIRAAIKSARKAMRAYA